MWMGPKLKSFYLLICHIVTYFQANKQMNKRICASEAESQRSSKRQRISHIKNNNNIIKEPEGKSPNSVDKSKLSKTSSNEGTEPVSLPDREVVESSTTGNLDSFFVKGYDHSHDGFVIVGFCDNVLLM